MSKKYVYLFNEGNASMKNLLGGKGANLAEMTNIGLPVPPGFTITTEACKKYYENGGVLPQDIVDEIFKALESLEKIMNKKFGDPENPLLVSVRSGAPVSMPGMMDTILNLGLNEKTVEGLIRATENPRFALDCYRRFIQMFGDVVMKIEGHKFESILNNIKSKYGLNYDTELKEEHLKEVITEYKNLVRKETKKEFPEDVKEQLLMAVNAVFESWNNNRAIVYRKINKIPDDLGTAVNVQSMVFGNMGETSGTGVAFTRNPSTGVKELYGEFLLNAQGEDVVAGIRTPQHISALKDVMPEVFEQFLRVCELLEKHYRDLQDIEFTVQEGKLYMLQTRSGKRTAQAAIKIAVDMVEEGLITKEEAIMRISPENIEKILHKQIDPNTKVEIIAKGLPASPGAATGMVVFDADEAERLGNEGKKVILVRTETTPDDIHGLVAAQGVLTSRGGMTSHAAVVARGMGKPAVCGCEAIKIDLEKELFMVGDLTVKKGDIISIDGSLGNVILGEVKLVDPVLSEEFMKLLEWADEVAKIKVRANADTPEDARRAREFGAVGIGLCRTEHMFMAQDRLPIVQEMIMAETKEEREKALAKLLPFQQSDFEGIFKAMQGFPVTIRLLDPPLHEFLPDLQELLVEVTKMKLTGAPKDEIERVEAILSRVKKLSEFNPMLGHRGCRLGIVFPEIYEMQVRAILKAAANVMREGYKVLPEIMIPLVGIKEEIKIMKEMVDRVAKEVMDSVGMNIEYKFGTMIEIPRACTVADEIAEYAEFFSFGTNDLTQTTFGFSRDDAEGKFLPYYLENKILPVNPFEKLDRNGVGKLIKMAVELGRKVRPNIKLGICGEHGGEPSSIEFCYITGLDYVSCSPFRVPVARLAAAQATIKNR